MDSSVKMPSLTVLVDEQAVTLEVPDNYVIAVLDDDDDFISPPPPKRRRKKYTKAEEDMIKEFFKLEERTKSPSSALCVEFLGKYQGCGHFEGRSSQNIQLKLISERKLCRTKFSHIHVRAQARG